MSAATAPAISWPSGPVAVMLVGASGSGKSTLAARLAADLEQTGREAAVLSWDACRHELTGDEANQAINAEAVALTRIRLARRCCHRQSTVVDATHVHPADRAQVMAITAHHQVPVIAVALDIPLRECLRRMRGRDRQVPDDVVAAQHAALQRALPLLPYEGYHALHVLTATHHAEPAAGGGLPRRHEPFDTTALYTPPTDHPLT